MLTEAVKVEFLTVGAHACWREGAKLVPLTIELERVHQEVAWRTAWSGA